MALELVIEMSHEIMQMVEKIKDKEEKVSRQSPMEPKQLTTSQLQETFPKSGQITGFLFLTTLDSFIHLFIH